MKKTIITSYPFPLIKMTVNIKYTEVQKPSGVGYIILVLIKDAKNRNERLGDIIRRFGVPDDLCFIFADEMAVLLGRDILRLINGNKYESEYFDEYAIDNFSFTENGERMFREGAIPTGEKKKKPPATLYFNPLINEFAFTAPPYMVIEKTDCYPQGFMERVETDVSGLKEFLINNARLAGLQKEERLLECAVAGQEYLVTKQADNLEIRIDNDEMDVDFKTAGAEDFYKKYFTSDMLERGLAAKTKFQFSVKTTTVKGFSCFKNLTTGYLPDEYKAQLERPAKLLLIKDDEKVNVKHKGSIIVFESGTTIAKAASATYPDWSFITIDNKEMRYYTAAKVELMERTLAGPLSLNLLIEQRFEAEQKARIIKTLFDECTATVFSEEYADIVKTAYELTGKAALITGYMEHKLKSMGDKAKQAEILLAANGIFANITEWQTAAVDFANKIYNDLISGMTEENVRYSVKIAGTLNNIRNTNKNEILPAIAEKFANADEISLFNIITGAGFKENDALPFANVVKVYIDKILAGGIEMEKSALSDGFAGLANNLDDLKTNLGLRSTIKYAFREGYAIDKFIEDYKAFKSKLGSLKKYSGFAREGFEKLDKYAEIMQPVFDYIMIEQNATAQPEKISESYIRDKIDKGDYRTAVGDMIIRLDYSLGKTFGENTGGVSGVFDKIERAQKKYTYEY